ncbi:MAG: hypothetical protein AB7O56_01555 [Bauldia sp.]
MLARKMRGLLAAIALSAAAVTAAYAQTPMGPAMTATSPLGTILVGPEGMTLYTWDRDTEPNVSTCYDQCAVNWPPFVVEAGAVAEGDWTIVPRTDGTSIWAYMGKPLYYFINDAAPGDTNGNQPDGTWHAVVIP